MGGKSKSNQTTDTHTQNTNLAIQGDNEGQVIGGDGNHVTNTTSTLEIGEEFTGGNRFGDDYTGGNRTDIGDDYTGGNRTEIDGDFVGGNRTETEIDGNFYNGDYTVTDGGAFDLVESVVGDAFESQNDALRNSLDFATQAAAGANQISKAAIDEMGNVNRDSLNFGKSVVDDSLSFGKSALDEMSDVQSNAMDNVTDSVKLFAEELSELSTSSVDAVNSSAKLAIAENSETTTKGLATIEQLAAKTALGGQTVVAEQAGKMAMYFMFGAALIFLGLLVSGRAK